MVMNKGMESNAKHVLNSVNLNNEEKNTNRDFNPSVLGREFVRQYYTMLNEGPQNLFRFYSDNSSLIHGNEPGENVTPAFGQADINKKLMSLNFRDCHTKIRQVDSLETVNKSVVIQVIGELSNNGQPMRRFFQTFILAPRTPTHYYVRNDIFRYQDEVFVEDDEGYTEENVEDSNHIDNNLDSNENVLNSSLVVNKSDKMNGTFNDNDKLNNDLDNFSCMNPEISPINPEEISGSEKSVESKNFKLADKEIGLTQSKDSLEDQKSSDLETENQLTSSVIVEERQNQPKTYATMVQRTYGNLSSSVTPSLNNNFEKKPVNKNSTGFPKPGEDTNLNTNNFESGKNKEKDDFLSNSENWQCENSNESSENIETQDLNNKRNNLSNNSQQHSDDQQVFVGNLPQNINETHLRQFFIEYGEIIDIRINRQNQKQGKTPNYGFITFSEASVVKKILSEKPIYFNSHRINVEEKRSHSGRNFNNNNQGNFVRNQNNNVCSINNHLNNNRNFNNSSGSSNNQFAFNSRGLRDQERNNRGFNNDKRKTTLNSNNSGNRAQNNFNRR